MPRFNFVHSLKDLKKKITKDSKKITPHSDFNVNVNQHAQPIVAQKLAKLVEEGFLEDMKAATHDPTVLDVRKDLRLLPPSFVTTLSDVTLISSPCSSPNEKTSPLPLIRQSSTETLVATPCTAFSINDFAFEGLLGAGGFGKVYYVKHKIRGDIYALKVIPRVEGNIDREALVLREQQTIVALAGLSGVVELDASSFDSMNFFMLMPVYPMSVLDLVNCTGRLGLAHNVAKFYFIQLLGALSSIHMKGIIHRDVKLDNCLIDRNGYLVLADFGLARDFGSEVSFKVAASLPYAFCDLDKEGEQRVCLRQKYIPFMATRLCGTAEYMAPELCAGLPYAFQVDVWAASICLFEMLFGKTPWFQRHRGADVRARIMSEPLVLPNRNIGKLARDFLERSLAKNPCERLSMDEMRFHPYTSYNEDGSVVEGNKIVRHQVPSPYIPESLELPIRKRLSKPPFSVVFGKACETPENGPDPLEPFNYVSPKYAARDVTEKSTPPGGVQYHPSLDGIPQMWKLGASQ